MLGRAKIFGDGSTVCRDHTDANSVTNDDPDSTAKQWLGYDDV
jgi:hypothetical protein